MKRPRYSLEDVANMEQEIAPLVLEYKSAVELRYQGKMNYKLPCRKIKRLLELSSKLTDYYVFQKVWNTSLDYLKARIKTDPFGMFFHRESVLFPCARIKEKINKSLTARNLRRTKKCN